MNAPETQVHKEAIFAEWADQAFLSELVHLQANYEATGNVFHYF